MKPDYYTVGELSKLTGVSHKTILHYHKKGILCPVKVTDTGYRLYDAESVKTLQRIMMLKYLDFSLDEIGGMLQSESAEDCFARQAELLQAQKEHLELVIHAVEEIRQLDEEEQWSKMLDIIRLTRHREEVADQYKKADNLQKRINIHEYSTSKENWSEFVLKGLQLKKGMKILDVGCGNAWFWVQMREQLPEDLTVYLVDHSRGMLQEAEESITKKRPIYDEKRIHFIYVQKNAEAFEWDEDGFDLIMANHMLYHVSNTNREKFLKQLAERLKIGGMFYASTVGEQHMQQLHELRGEFDPRMEEIRWTAGFTLENGKAQLERVFNHVERQIHDNDLLVPDAKAIYDYIESLSDGVRKVLKERGKEFMKFLDARVSAEKPFFIHKSTGAFIAYK